MSGPSPGKHKGPSIIRLDSTKIQLVVDEAAFNADDAKRQRTDSLKEVTAREYSVPWKDLQSAVRGNVYRRSLDPKEFTYHSIVMNAACQSSSLVVVCPLDAKDVSVTIRFARTHKLSVSAKSGGFNVAGWTVRGDIIIDCSRLTQVSIKLPGEKVPIEGHARLLSKRPRAPEAYDSQSQYPPDPYSDFPATVAASSSKGKAKEVSETPSPTTASSTNPSREESGSSSATSATSQSAHAGPSTAKKPRLPQNDNSVWRSTNSWVDDQQGHSFPAISAGMSSPSDPNVTLPLPAGTGEAPGGSLPSQFSSAASNFNPWNSGPSSLFPFSSVSPQHMSQSLTPQDSQSGSSGLGAVIAASPNPVNSDSSRSTTPPESSSNGSAPPAIVSVGSGVAVRQVDEFTAPYGYHVPLSAYPVGSASYHSGGFGFLSRKHGLTMDNIIGLEIVMADGEIVNLIDTKSDEFADLSSQEQERQKEMWWMCRGAAMTIGIVTRMDMLAHPISRVYAVDLIFPFNSATAPSLLKHWRDCLKDLPNDIFSSIILTAGPTPATSVIVVNICYTGIITSSNNGHPVDIGPVDVLTQAITSWQGEMAMFKQSELRSFLEQQDTNAKVLKVDADMRWSVRASLAEGLSDECIYETCNRFAQQPERTVWLFESAGGAIATVDPESTCYPIKNRKALFEVAAIHQWRGENEDALSKQQAWSWIRDVICADSDICGPFPCFFECDEGLDRVSNTFGQNWDRLLKIKQRLDPDNVFSNNFMPTDAKLKGKQRADVMLADPQDNTALTRGQVDAA